MYDIKEAWRVRIAAALSRMAADAGLDSNISPDSIVAEVPPKPELGDFGFPLFPFAKLLRKGPPQIAAALAAAIADDPHARDLGIAAAEGPYLNVKINRSRVVSSVISAQETVGRPQSLAGQKIMIEFSSPNTNKPLHLGHLRNDALGESMSRILKACGADVKKVCIINDRGVHICKSMLAWQKFFNGKTPETEGLKSDRFVGDCYVRFNQFSKEDPTAEAQAQELLRKWEAGDEETLELWKTMNEWAVRGMQATYKRTGVSFDTYYYESQTYLEGKSEVLEGLERGVFHRAEDGSVQIDLSDEGLDKKVLLRKDGTSIYITQDIGTAISRHRDWPFDRLVYVVGSEQQYHFRVLFRILELLGYEWAPALHHLSYGMVNLPEGRMKSREGTVVDADDLIDSLRDLALEEIREKEREDALDNPAAIAEAVALGALHYYLLQATAAKDMIFNPKESLSFNGNTGPYLQYMVARIHSMLAKAKERGAGEGPVDPALLVDDAEWALAKTCSSYAETVSLAGERMDPSILASWLYELSKAFSRFYHDCPILGAEDPVLRDTRIALARSVLAVMEDALSLICIPVLKKM